MFLVYTGAKIIRHRADEGTEESTRGLSILRRIMPVTDELDGQRFFTRVDAKRAATPLLAALFGTVWTIRTTSTVPIAH